MLAKDVICMFRYCILPSHGYDVGRLTKSEGTCTTASSDSTAKLNGVRGATPYNGVAVLQMPRQERSESIEKAVFKSWNTETNEQCRSRLFSFAIMGQRAAQFEMVQEIIRRPDNRWWRMLVSGSK
jgi:hypothetical protein